MLAISNHTLHSKGLARLLASGGAGNSPNVNAIFTTDFIRIKKYSYFFLWASDARECRCSTRTDEGVSDGTRSGSA
jgi:hypothetical protein